MGLVPQLDRQPAEISQQPHSVLFVHAPLLVRRSQPRSYPGTNHQGSPRKVDRQQTASMGSFDHVYRTDQESPLRVLGTRVRSLRAGNPKVVRIGGSFVHGGTHAAAPTTPATTCNRSERSQVNIE